MFLYRRFLIWLTKTKFYKFMLKSVVPYIRFTTYYTNFSGLKYHEGYKLLKGGDILVMLDDKKLTTRLIGGEFSHAEFCLSVGWSPFPEIVGMTHEDYRASFFFDTCKESTRVVILRCLDFDLDYIDGMKIKAASFVNAKYDSEFSLGIEALYCSELIYHIDYEKRLQLNLEDLRGLGTKYISPDGLYKAKNVRIVWDSNK